MNLTASVRLADGLASAEALLPGVSFHAPFLLGDYVRRRLASIEEATFRHLDRPFEGFRIRVADPLRLFAQLVASDAAKSPEGARSFAVSTWATYREFLLASVARARAEVAELHGEVAADLRSASPRGVRLEALDGIVRGAVNDAVPALLERLATAMETPFVTTLTEAILGLTATEAVDSAVIAPWFAPHGTLGAQLARTSEIVRALLAHEARWLLVLVDTACNGGRA